MFLHYNCIMVSERQNTVKKSHTVNISDAVYNGLKEMLIDRKTTLTDLVNDSLTAQINRNIFLKMYAPHLSEDYVSKNAIFLNDLKLCKTAIVKIKEHPDSDLDNSGFYGYCETCNSDSCIHVRYCLASASILKLDTQGKMV